MSWYTPETWRSPASSTTPSPCWKCPIPVRSRFKARWRRRCWPPKPTGPDHPPPDREPHRRMLPLAVTTRPHPCRPTNCRSSGTSVSTAIPLRMAARRNGHLPGFGRQAGSGTPWPAPPESRLPAPWRRTRRALRLPESVALRISIINPKREHRAVPYPTNPAAFWPTTAMRR